MFHANPFKVKSPNNTAICIGEISIKFRVPLYEVAAYEKNNLILLDINNFFLSIREKLQESENSSLP